MSPKTITILGSTGIQGASVLHYLLEHPPSPDSYNLRAITTRPGPHVSLPSPTTHPNFTIHVLNDTTSPSELTPILSPSHIIFANTNSLDPRYDGKPGSPTEFDALKAIIDVAANSPHVELLVLSCLPELADGLGDKSKDYRNKAEGMKYAKKIAKEKGLRVVFVQLAWYFSNFVEDVAPVVNAEDGFVEFSMKGLLQDKRIPWISAYTDLGPIVKALIDNPEPYLGKEIPLVSELLTMDEIARIYQSVTNQPSRAISPPLPPTTSPDYSDEWATLMETLNKEAFFVDETIMQLPMEVIKQESPHGLTGWAKWLVDTGFDARKKNEGFGEVIRGRKEKWGGKAFV